MASAYFLGRIPVSLLNSEAETYTLSAFAKEQLKDNRPPFM